MDMYSAFEQSEKLSGPAAPGHERLVSTCSLSSGRAQEPSRAAAAERLQKNRTSRAL